MYTVYTDIHVFIKPYFYKTVYITIMRLISYETMRNKEVLRDIRAQKKKKTIREATMIHAFSKSCS